MSSHSTVRDREMGRTLRDLFVLSTGLNVPHDPIEVLVVGSRSSLLPRRFLEQSIDHYCRRRSRIFHTYDCRTNSFDIYDCTLSLDELISLISTSLDRRRRGTNLKSVETRPEISLSDLREHSQVLRICSQSLFVTNGPKTFDEHDVRRRCETNNSRERS